MALDPSTQRQLEQVRQALLVLHKALLDHERTRYEQVRGAFKTSGEVLQAVLKDPWFAWLRDMSGLIVQIDEFLADDEAAVTTPQALLDAANRLITPTETESEFQREYHRALQQSPEVVMAHSELKKLFPKKKSS